MALGRVIVRQLELERRGEVPTRWMAHHLAELIQAADMSEGDGRQAAEDRAAKLILELWANRRALPTPADPLSGYSDAIKVLRTMLPSGDPWSRHRRQGSIDALLHDMFGAMAQLVMSGLFLTRDVEIRAIEEAEWDALSEEERFLTGILDRWHRFFAPPPPKEFDLGALYAAFLEGDDGLEVGSSIEESPAPEEEAEPDPAEVNRAAVISHVETFQARLAELLAQWRDAKPENDTDDDED